MKIIKMKEMKKINENSQNQVMDEIDFLDNSLIHYEKKLRIITLLIRFFIIVGVVLVSLSLWLTFIILELPWNKLAKLPIIQLTIGFLSIFSFLIAYFLLEGKKNAVNNINKIERKLGLVFYNKKNLNRKISKTYF